LKLVVPAKPAVGVKLKWPSANGDKVPWRPVTATQAAEVQGDNRQPVAIAVAVVGQ
jgi:hypothetical protein